ncbi:hypothetical protein ANN_20251 [Periplaneta americana]|uniref:Uncharacterized protein n=1 Tax=Periplaneta americana TaxID=6978 RepID=A0ABQ8SC49_PERAM|nr:hypothetical protein ANN_20251 [Periplaneta americana]
MAGLCEGGNEPPRSLKASKGWVGRHVSEQPSAGIHPATPTRSGNLQQLADQTWNSYGELHVNSPSFIVPPRSEENGPWCMQPFAVMRDGSAELSDAPSHQ